MSFSPFRSKATSPFHVHTAHDTLLGRTDIPLPHSPISSHSRDIGCGTDEINHFPQEKSGKNQIHSREYSRNMSRERGSPSSSRSPVKYKIGNENEKTEVNQMTMRSDDDTLPEQQQWEPQLQDLSPQELTRHWETLHSTLLELIDLGYDRSLLYALLPSVEQRIFHQSLHVVYERFLKRVSESWQSDEPSKVVELCQRWNHSYEILSRHFSDHHRRLPHSYS
jgi:hypothetical protein